MTSSFPPGNSITNGMPHGLPLHAQFVLLPHLCDTVCTHLSRSDIAQCIRVCESWCEAFKPCLWTRLDLSDYQLFHRFITSAVIPDHDDPSNEALRKYSKDLKEQDLPPSTSPHSFASNLKARAIRTGSPIAWMEYSFYLAMPQSICATLGDNHNRSLLHLLRIPHGTIRNSFLIQSLQVEFHSRLAPCSIVGPHSNDSTMMVSDTLHTRILPLPLQVPGTNKLMTATTTTHFHQYVNLGRNLVVEMGVSQEQLSSLSLLPASHQQSAFMSFLSQCENLVRLSLVCVGSEAVAENLAFYCPVLEELELKCRRKSGTTTAAAATTTGRGDEKGGKNYNLHCSDRAIARLILSATSFAGFDTDLDTIAYTQQGASPQRQLKKFAVDSVDQFGQKCVQALVHAHPRLEYLAIKNCESVKSDHWHLLLSSFTCLREADFQSEGEQEAYSKSARAQTGLREWKSGIPQFVPVVSLESLLLSGKSSSATRPLNLASLSKAMWICGATLRVLKLGVANFSYSYPQEILSLLDQDRPLPEAKGMYTWLFSHLAGLEQLQELWLSDHLLDHGHRRRAPRHGVGGLQHESVVESVTFHLTLEAGLDMLAGLKRLRVLDVRDLDHRIGLSEVGWMVENWPGLSILRGLVSTVWLSHRPGHNEKLAAAERAAGVINWLSQCHPHIQIE